jgi:hypothetical protein
LKIIFENIVPIISNSSNMKGNEKIQHAAIEYP